MSSLDVFGLAVVRLDGCKAKSGIGCFFFSLEHNTNSVLALQPCQSLDIGVKSKNCPPNFYGGTSGRYYRPATSELP